jgi:hypothetical protein
MTDQEQLERDAKVAELERREDDAMRDAVNALSNVVNRGGSPERFVRYMNREHRTLQQSMTGLMLAWFKHLSALTENQYDARNAASVQVAKKVMIVTDGATRLPFI